MLSRVIKPLKARRLPFVIELPPYRLPRLRDVLHMMWERSRQFLSEAGTVIVACTWCCGCCSASRASRPSRRATSPRTSPRPPAPSSASAIEQQQEAERIQQSYGGRLGHAIEPVMRPLGFDWKIGVGLIGAFAAREVFVATMGVVYGVGDEADEQTPGPARPHPGRTPRRRAAGVHAAGGVSLMVFFALSCQCMSTLAVVRRETGGLRWPLFCSAT